MATNKWVIHRKNWLAGSIPLGGGILIAGFVSMILWAAKPVWVFLVAIGILTLSVALVIKDVQRYFLAFFILTLPLNIKKVLVEDNSYHLNLVDTYGYPPGAHTYPVLFLSDMVFGVLFFLWVYRLFMRQQELVFPKLFWVVLAYIRWSGVTMAMAPEKWISLFEVIQRIKYVLIFFYLVNNMTKLDDIHYVLKLFVIGIAFQGMLSIYNYTTQSIQDPFQKIFGTYEVDVDKVEDHLRVSGEKAGELFRVSGTVNYSNPNSQGQYYAMVLPYAIFLFIAARNGWARFLWLVTFGLGLTGLVVTFSRGALAAFIVSTFMFIVFGTYRKKISEIALFMFLVVALLSVPFVYYYMTTRVEFYNARFPLWSMALSLIQSHPLTGVGVNNAVVVGSTVPDPEQVFFGAHFHNHFLTTTVEIGIIGLLLYLFPFVISYLKAFRSFHSQNDPRVNWLSIIMPAAFLGTLMHLMADKLAGEINNTHFWIFAALALSLSRIKRVDKSGLERRN